MKLKLLAYISGFLSALGYLAIMAMGFKWSGILLVLGICMLVIVLLL